MKAYMFVWLCTLLVDLRLWSNDGVLSLRGPVWDVAEGCEAMDAVLLLCPSGRGFEGRYAEDSSIVNSSSSELEQFTVKVTHIQLDQRARGMRRLYALNRASLK